MSLIQSRLLYPVSAVITSRTQRRHVAKVLMCGSILRLAIMQWFALVIVMEEHHADSLMDFGVCGQIGFIYMDGVYCECHGG